MTRMRNIIVSIIQNSAHAGEAADMLIRLFGAVTEPDQLDGSAHRPRDDAGPAPPPADNIEADGYYSVEVMRQHTGYSAKHIYTMIRLHKVVSKLEAHRRLVLGSEILRVRKARELKSDTST